MNVLDELLAFLVRNWSKTPDVTYKRGNAFTCDPAKKEIGVPDFFNNEDAGSQALDLHGFNKWRWWRFCGFHEARHQFESPRDKEAFSETVVQEAKTHLSLPLIHISRGELAVAGRVVNLFEDYRIEKRGLREYIGYIPERRWRIEVAKKHWMKPDEEVLTPEIDIERGPNNSVTWRSPGSKLNKIEVALLNLKRSLLLESPVGDPLIDGWAERGREVETIDELHEISVEVMAHLIEKYPDDIPASEACNIFAMFNSMDAEEVDAENPELRANSFILAEWDSLKQNIGDVEASIVEGGVKQEQEETRLQMRSVRPSSGDAFTLPGEGDLITQRLMTMLKKWQVGWVEVYSDAGDDVDPEEYVLSRTTDSKHQKFFIDERILSPKSELCVLVDMSGSISGDNLTQPYKDAVCRIGHALRFIGTKFAVYGFSGQSYGLGSPSCMDAFYVVKELGEQWNLAARSRLAGMMASGGTPLAKALRLVGFKQSVHRFKRVVIITDGEPDSLERSARAARDLAQGGLEVSVLAYRVNAADCSKAIGGARRIVGWRGRVVAIHDMANLPAAFFELIKA